MNESRLVYRTGESNLCTRCSKLLRKCSCQPSVEKSLDGIVKIRREIKKRKGAGVTIISELGLASDNLKRITKELKKHCGVGGTLKDTTIEIQGDQRIKSKDFLEKLGYKVRLTGG